MADIDCTNKHDSLCKTFDKKLELRVAVVETRIDEMEKAVKLQTAELDRRLGILNGHQEELKNDRDQFVRKDMYDRDIGFFEKWREEATKDLTTIKVTRANIIWAVAVILSLLGIFIYRF